MKLLEKIGDYNEIVLLKEEDRSITNKEFILEVDKLYNKYKQLPLQVCFVDMQWGIESVIAFFALAKAKWILIPVLDSNLNSRVECATSHFQFKEKRLTHLTSKVQKKLISELNNKGQAGLILFSSGTTNTAKQVLLNLDNLMDKYLKMRTRTTTILLYPLNHIAGIEVLLSVISAAGTVFLTKNNTLNRILEVLDSNKIDFISSTPSFLKLLGLHQNGKEVIRKIKAIKLGGERTSESDFNQFKNIYPNAKFSQVFGTTETSQLRTINSNGLSINIGKLGDDYLVKDGMLYLRSPFSMKGYLDTDLPSDEWFCTGDLVEKQPRGMIKFIGRKSEIISVGGEKVVPSEVEEVLLRHPNVQDVYVYGEENALLGQMVIARIVSTEPIDKLTLRQHCRKFLPEFKVPFRILFADKLEITDRLKRSR